jgi:hypothetical protein
MITNTTIIDERYGPAGAAPYIDLPSARDFIVALGRVYLEAGLPLSAAFEAAFADYRSFGLPAQCEN